MEVFILLFFGFSVLSTAWLPEMTVFSRILRKKSGFRISEKRCLRKSENLGLELKLKIFMGVKCVRKEVFLDST